jgi:serine/threonine protein phosphatase PrpC
MRARGAAVRRDLTFVFDAAAMSDKGTVRATNEDQARMMLAPGLFMVADGMGGHQSGEVASLFCVTSMSNTLAGLPSDLPAEDF